MSAPKDPAQRRDDDAMTFAMLRFDVGGLACAFDVQDVVEVVRVVAVTRLPHVASALAGVVSLRGVVLPILDLRTTLGEPCGPFDVETRIIVVPVRVGPAVPPVRAAAGPPKPSERLVGFVVDRVHDVDTVPETAANEATSPSSLPARLVRKILQSPGRIVLVLDPHGIIGAGLGDALEAAWRAQAGGLGHAA